MKVYLQPTGLHSRAMVRVAAALRRYAPPHVQVVTQQSQADVEVWHVIGPITGVDESKPHAIIQYCLQSITNWPNKATWNDHWSRSMLVWSYYDLPAALGTAPNFPTKFYYRPLGVDEAFTLMALGTPNHRDIGVITSGYVTGPGAEAIEECAMAACLSGLNVVHIGPNRVANMSRQPSTWTAINGISDGELAQLYRRSRWVSGLRHIEGFELPVLEGLFCGARPIVFDRPEMRHWYGAHAVYVPETTGDELIQHLLSVFSTKPTPVDFLERKILLEQFHWASIATGFWRALES